MPDHDGWRIPATVCRAIRTDRAQITFHSTHTAGGTSRRQAPEGRLACVVPNLPESTVPRHGLRASIDRPDSSKFDRPRMQMISMKLERSKGRLN